MPYNPEYTLIPRATLRGVAELHKRNWPGSPGKVSPANGTLVPRATLTSTLTSPDEELFTVL